MIDSNMRHDVLDLHHAGARLRIAYHRRTGHLPPVVSLHGFGSTKEDYADLALLPGFADRDLIAFDAPGFGASEIDRPELLSIPFLAEVTTIVLDALDVPKAHLTGHSMGGLTALVLAYTDPGRVLSFFDIEGNLAPEDCFLSRQIVDFPAATPDAFLEDFQTRVRARPELGSALYAATLPFKVRPASIAPVFRSMVELSDTEPLLDMMAALPCPKAFVYGAQNRHLSYLPDLPGRDVQVIELDHAGHFPMYTNPKALWAALSEFVRAAETP